MRRSRRALWGALLVLALFCAWAAASRIASAAFVLDLAGETGWVRRVLPARIHAVTSRDLSVSTRHGPVPARLYEPDRPPRATLLVVPGIQAGGVDEPRLDTFAGRLAATGVRVLTLPLPDLREFRITTRSTDLIEDAVLWMTGDVALAPTGRIGLAGVSFAGGLALVAAGRASIAGRLDLVVSIGGHGDLPRVLTHVASGRFPDGLPPHDYGTAVLLLAAADYVVPASQVEPLRTAVVHYLLASSLDGTQPDRARVELAEAHRLRDAMIEPARTYLGWVLTHDVTALGEALLPWVDRIGADPALSPDRSPPPQAPVFLLHGAGDRVIPTDELGHIAQRLRSAGHPRVRALVTPVLRHADPVPRASFGDVVALIEFWRDVIRTADASGV
jgi:dienelactone hydrolase